MSDDLANLPEASFAGVTFPVQDVDTEGGQDVVEHVAYRRRGADLEPTGLRAYKGTLTVPMINAPALVKRYGQMFPGLRADLINAIESNPLGQLTHPTFGVFTAAVTTLKEHLAPDTRNGSILTLSWTEHYGQASQLIGPDGGTPTSAPNATQYAATTAEAAMGAADPTGSYTPVASVVSAQLEYLDAAPRSTSEVLDATRKMLVPVNANLALPVFNSGNANAPAASAATSALLALRAEVYRLRASYAPSGDAPRLYTVPQTAPLWQVSQDVYGRCDRVALLLTANVITTPNAVLAGTVLTVLPQPD